MAQYGARNSMWAPWAAATPDEDKSKLPKYESAKSFGELNKVNDAPNFVSGSLPGDDQIVLYKKQFKDGTVTAASVFLPVADVATMTGAAKNEKMGMAQGDDDEAPYIGFGFHTQHVSKAKTYFEVVFFPKLQAHPVAGEYETRGENITFKADKMEFGWLSPLCGKYRIIEDFETEAEAKTYLAGLFTGTVPVPGLSGVPAHE